MVAGAHSDAQLVEQQAHVIAVDVAHQKRHDSTLVGSGAIDACTVNLEQPARHGLQQLVLVSGDVGHAQFLDIVDGPGQGGNAHIVGRTGLKLERQLGKGCLVERDVPNHLATTLIGRHAVEPLLLAIEHPHAGGSIHLVARQGIEVAVQVLHVQGQVWCGLGAVDQHGHIMPVGDGYHLLDRVDRAQHIAHMGQCHKAGVVGEHVLVGLEVQLAIVADGLAAADELPWHDVAVMFHDSEDDLVVVLKHVAHRRGHQVDALGGATGEDDLLNASGIDVSAHLVASGLDQVGGLLRQSVHATMHVGLVAVIHLVDGVDHATGSQRGGSIVQIDERPALDCAIQDGILTAYFFDVQQLYRNLIIKGNSHLLACCRTGTTVGQSAVEAFLDEIAQAVA